MKPVVRNIQNNQLYFFEGGNTFRNIVTGNSGEVQDEKAREVFRFNLDATKIINEFPLAEELIKVLKLKFDNTKNEQNEKRQ